MIFHCANSPAQTPKYFVAEKGTKTREFAKQMRNQPTRGEAAFWQISRRKQMSFRILRQRPVMGWIPDFYCPHVNLIIEIDGLGHTYKHDDLRTHSLNQNGFSVLRSQKPRFVLVLFLLRKQ